jgi:hypothetical protein
VVVDPVLVGSQKMGCAGEDAGVVGVAPAGGLAPVAGTGVPEPGTRKRWLRATVGEETTGSELADPDLPVDPVAPAWSEAEDHRA